MNHLLHFVYLHKLCYLLLAANFRYFVFAYVNLLLKVWFEMNYCFWQTPTIFFRNCILKVKSRYSEIGLFNDKWKYQYQLSMHLRCYFVWHIKTLMAIICKLSFVSLFLSKCICHNCIMKFFFYLIVFTFLIFIQNLFKNQFHSIWIDKL